MILLLHSFSLVRLVVGICAEMDETSFALIQSCFAADGICAEMDVTSFAFIQFCFAAGRDLRRDG